MIDIVCVYNNYDILEKNLLQSLKLQTARYNLILIDNRTHQFPSAAKALNYGGRKANSEYIMFVHQDIYIPDPYWLAIVKAYLNNINDIGIAGVAGMIAGGYSNKERGRNIIKHGKELELWSWGNPIDKPVPVQSLDECLFIIPKKVFNIYQFDEVVCPYWDLYAVDYGLNIQSTTQFKTYVLPVMVYHKSMGRLTREYFISLNKIVKKHRHNYNRINTTTGSWVTAPLLSFMQMKTNLICIKVQKLISSITKQFKLKFSF